MGKISYRWNEEKIVRGSFQKFVSKFVFVFKFHCIVVRKESRECVRRMLQLQLCSATCNHKTVDEMRLRRRGANVYSQHRKFKYIL